MNYLFVRQKSSNFFRRKQFTQMSINSIFVRVIAGSGFEQMSDPRTVLGSDRTAITVRRVGQVLCVRPVELF